MKSNIFIIHGAYGHPEENWFPWLKARLERYGYQVLVPKFLTPENQSLSNWLETFKDYRSYLNEESVVVGHSLGPAFLLNVIEELNHPIKAAFFVSGFIGLLGNPQFDKINKTFVVRDFNWEKIRRNCRRFYLFHSDNDPYVPLNKAVELAKNLKTYITLIPDAGHFNEKAGYTNFPLLLEKILAELEK